MKKTKSGLLRGMMMEAGITEKDLEQVGKMFDGDIQQLEKMKKSGRKADQKIMGEFIRQARQCRQVTRKLAQIRGK